MKLFIKEMFYKLLMFIILGLTWYIFIQLNFFNDGVFGFICFGITYILVELIYKMLKEKTKILNKKITMVVSIAIAFTMLSSVIMALIDYNMIFNGEEPVFTWKSRPTKVIFITYTQEGDMNEEKGVAITEYKGFGYSIMKCHENVVCDEKVKVLPFGLGNYIYQFTGRDISELD
jgi:hypothetical protein